MVWTTVTKVTPGGAISELGRDAGVDVLAGGGGGGGTTGEGVFTELVEEGNGRPGVVLEGMEPTAVLKLLETLASLAVEKDEMTLRAELVAEKVPAVSVGVVPASDIVGVVGRPCAFELSLLTELLLAAGTTDDSALDSGNHPELSW